LTRSACLRRHTRSSPWVWHTPTRSWPPSGRSDWDVLARSLALWSGHIRPDPAGSGVAWPNFASAVGARLIDDLGASPRAAPGARVSDSNEYWRTLDREILVELVLAPRSHEMARSSGRSSRVTQLLHTLWGGYSLPRELPAQASKDCPILHPNFLFFRCPPARGEVSRYPPGGSTIGRSLGQAELVARRWQELWQRLQADEATRQLGRDPAADAHIAVMPLIGFHRGAGWSSSLPSVLGTCSPAHCRCGGKGSTWRRKNRDVERWNGQDLIQAHSRETR
jgi:hypothetical protein